MVSCSIMLPAPIKRVQPRTWAVRSASTVHWAFFSWRAVSARASPELPAVELPVGVGAAAAVAAHDPVAREIDHGEIADYAAPQREGRPFGFVEGEIIGPRQQPQKQHEHGEAEK